MKSMQRESPGETANRKSCFHTHCVCWAHRVQVCHFLVVDARRMLRSECTSAAAKCSIQAALSTALSACEARSVLQLSVSTIRLRISSGCIRMWLEPTAETMQVRCSHQNIRSALFIIFYFILNKNTVHSMDAAQLEGGVRIFAHYIRLVVVRRPGSESMRSLLIIKIKEITGCQHTLQHSGEENVRKIKNLRI